MSDFLKVESVSKAYPGESLGAVNEVSFTMKQGEIFSLVGESGSGKSTLLRMLAGLLKADEGSIVFQDRPLDNPDEQLIAGHPSIKMVFQDFDLMPNMTVAENLRYPLLAYDKGFAEGRVNELLRLCRIEALAAKLPRELSGGQQQRVALARALADEPDLLLMDEPFSQLDPVNKTALLQEILRILKAEEVALILVTHDTRDALMISDRIGFLQAGALLQTGSPDKLYNEPANKTVASFFGTVNLFSPEEVRLYLPHLLSIMKERGASNIGIRAEHIELVEEGGTSHLELEYSRGLFLGYRHLVHSTLNGKKQIILFGQGSEVMQDSFNVAIPTENLLFFYD